MTLFSILICLALQRYLYVILPTSAWFKHYVKAMQHLFAASLRKFNWLNIATLLLPVFIICAGLTSLLHNVWLNSMNFLFQTAMLFLCMNAQPFKKLLAHYLRASSQQEQQTAFQYGLMFLEQDTILDGVTLSRAITQRILLQTHEQLLAVLFWYILFGATGAATYTAARLLTSPINSEASPALHKTALQVLAVLDWIPARLTAISYALMGHFGHSFNYLKQHLLNTKLSAEQLVIHTGLVAMEYDIQDTVSSDDEENNSALKLVDRSLVLWIVAIAVCTLASWIA